MSRVDFSLEIQGDKEGFVTFNCPFCDSDFKLHAREYQDEDNPISELYCPYCGLVDDHNHFLTHEIIEQIEIIVTNYMVEQLNKSSKKISSRNKSNVIKVDYKPLKKINIKELKEHDTEEEMFQCSNCGKKVKTLYCAGFSKIFCSYCGVDF